MSQSTELGRLLSEARLEGYREHLENELNVSSIAQLRQLRNYSELAQIGMKRDEIERLRRLLKGNTMSKLRKLKALHGRSLDLDVPPGSRMEPKSTRDAGTVNREGVWASESRQGVRAETGGSLSSKSSRSEFNPNAVKDLRPQVTGNRRLVQRSISASVDDERSVASDHFVRSSSLVRSAGREVSNGFLKPHKRKDVIERNSIDDILSVLSEPPYAAEATTSDDTSPLIQSDVEPFSRGRHSFDNLASVESTLEVAGGPSRFTTANGDSSNGLDENREVVVIESGRGKRKKPSLKISIPEPDNGVRCTLKPMSAHAERQINEAIELVSTLTRLSTDDRTKGAPRTPGSFSDGCTSPGGGHFFFSLRKNRSAKDEKRSFVDGLAVSAGEPDRVMTPGALEAYDALVTRTPGGDDARGDGLKDESSRRSWESSSGESTCSEERRVPVPPSHLVLDESRVGERRKEEAGRSLSNGLFSPPVELRNGHRALNRSREEEAGRRPDEECLSIGLFSPPLELRNGHHALNRSACVDLSDEERHRTRRGDCSITRLDDPLDDLSPPAYPAPTPPTAPVVRRPERFPVSPVDVPSEPKGVVDGSLPPLPEKKCRKDSVDSFPNPDSPPWYRAPSPPPSVPPPALPPRVRLRPSTVNCGPHERRFPLASDTFPRSHFQVTTEANDFVSGSLSHHQLHHKPKTFPRQTSEANHSGISDRRKTRPSRPSHSVESRSSCESDLGNLTHESEDSVFSDSVVAPSRAKPSVSGRPLKLDIRNVKLNAAELGIYDKADLFWVKSVNFDLPDKSQSEGDLQDVSAPIPGRYETSDSVSYEDLMEFALDGQAKRASSHSLMCEEVRILMKMFPNDVTVEDCMDALAETFWDVHSAVKLIKLKQVMSTGLADKQQCKQALLFCHWNVNEAALYLLTPPQQRITPDLVNV